MDSCLLVVVTMLWCVVVTIGVGWWSAGSSCWVVVVTWLGVAGPVLLAPCDVFPLLLLSCAAFPLLLSAAAEPFAAVVDMPY